MEAFVAAVHRELVAGPEGLGLRAGFEGRVANALADAIQGAPQTLDAHLSMVVAIEEELAAEEDHAPAARSWSAFVDVLVERWQHSHSEAFQLTHAHRDLARQRLALDAAGPKVVTKGSDVKAGPLARFALAADQPEPAPAPIKGARRTPFLGRKAQPEGVDKP